MTLWTQQRVDQLSALWADGLTGSEIARALGVGFSRSAVIGKAHRLRLAARRERGWDEVARSRNWMQRKVHHRQRQERRAKGKQPKPRQPKPPVFKPDAADIAVGAWNALPGTEPIGIMDLTSSTCRWPIGDPKQPGFGFCGAAPVAGSSYCATHRHRSLRRTDASVTMAKEDLRTPVVN